MSRAGRGRRAAARLAAGAVLAGCALLTAPQPASACAVGIGYKPSVSMDDLTHRRTCSTGSSAVGVAGFTALALGALATAGVVVFRRGERETSANPWALADYLDAAGVVPSARGDDDHAP
ncbi:hypothetical protein JIX56_07990 [Streptomyces sp. CA-210063]|uniref:hypothetical protein n=1 Tax=Streptomyces sp. CA-210063 TaxID=2801029 RepID=UPI00214B5481|nr:hypothetical protein [Streptomyces sp. CA-210063]UUU29829.1 hypothetical protein JIX56_07990 [Streptomyces sp. CA-210063]